MKKVLFIFPILFFIFCMSFSPFVSNAEELKVIVNTEEIAPPYEKPVWYKRPYFVVRDFLENFRKDNAIKLRNMADEYKKIIDEKQKAREELVKQQAKTDLENFKEKSYIDSSKGNPLKIPVDAIVYYFYNALAYIFATIWLFYSILGLITFLILRFIWVRIL